MKRVPMQSLRYDENEGRECLDGEPFTGVAYSEARGKQTGSECEYRDGLAWGAAREWFQDGRPAAECTYYRDVFHGRARRWDENGQLAEEGEFEYGITIWEKKWDEQGALFFEYQLKESDSGFETLQHFRKVYGPVDVSKPGRSIDDVS